MKRRHILNALKAATGRAWVALKQRYCHHVFRGVDIVPRDEHSTMSWPCSKCGKMFRLEYGLLAPGEITGPWGLKDDAKQ